MNQELKDYQELSKSINRFKAVIIGQDPYPLNPSGVAFCKNSFSELFKNTSQYRCCGQFLLYSLGLSKKTIEKHSDTFKRPIDVFNYLLENGIAILNSSYQLLDAPFIDGQPTQEFNKKLLRNNKEAIIEAYNYNLPFLEKTDKIILLGKLRTEPIFKHYYNKFSSEEILIHPSYYNSQKVEAIEEWDSIWNTKYLLKKIRSIENIE